MPELPEVEVTRRSFASEITGAQILAAVPGKPLRLRDLIDAPGDMDPAFRKLLGGHRYCRYEPTFDDCWTYNLRDQAIVTTDSLIASGALEQVFP
mgnify:CR=1 FL=1